MIIFVLRWKLISLFFLWLSQPLPCFSLCYNQPHLGNVTGVTSVLFFEWMWHVAVEINDRQDYCRYKVWPRSSPLESFTSALVSFCLQVRSIVCSRADTHQMYVLKCLRMQEAKKQVDFTFLVSLVVAYLLWYGSQPLGNLVIYQSVMFDITFTLNLVLCAWKRKEKKSTVIITFLFFMLSLIVAVPR